VNDDATVRRGIRKSCHPLGVALGQVVVHRDHVHAVAGQRIQVAREGRDQRLALAGLISEILPGAAPFRRSTAHRSAASARAPAASRTTAKPRQNLVQYFPLGGLDLFGVRNSLETRRNPSLELGGLRFQLFV